MIRKNIFTNKNIFVKLLSLYFISLILGAMNLGNGIVGSLLRFIAFFPFFWWLINKHAFTLSRPLLSASAFLLFSSLSVLWSVDVYSTFIKSIGYISLIALLCATSGYQYEEEDVLFLKKALIWSSRLTAIFVILLGETLSARLTFNGILTEDPNYICSYYLFGLVNALEKMLVDYKLFSKIKYLIEIIIYLILVFASGSRGGLLAIVIAILTVVILNLLFNKFSLKNLFVPILMVFISIIFMLFLPYILPDYILSRFSFQEVISSQGSGRYNIWQYYIYIFTDSNILRQLIGYGANALVSLVKQYMPIYINVAHNMFIECLMGVGIIGLLLYISMLWQFIRSSYIHKNIFAISVLIGMIALTLSTSFFGKAYWNILIYIICLDKIFYKYGEK